MNSNYSWRRVVMFGVFGISFCQLSGRFCAQEPGTIPQPLVLSSAVVNTTMRLGDAINIAISIKNTGENKVALRIENGKNANYRSFSFVLLKDGKEVDRSNFHRALRHEKNVADAELPPSFSSSLAVINPGQIDEMIINIGKLYLIKETGMYRLLVFMRPNADDSVLLAAKPLDFEIAP